MAKKLRRLLRIASLAMLFAGTAMAQSTSSITGVVTDASTGKPVVGAVVVVTSPALQAEQTAVTEDGGKYTVPGLPAGDYTLSVQFEGYKPFERADLKVKEGTTLRANASVVPEAVQMEEVVVTGSRIRRKDLNTPAPVTVLNREAVQSSGKVAVGDFLQSLPEQGNAINTAVNNGGDGSVRISLRSLGDARTLVLVNGRRMVPGGGGADSSVDLNTIPTAAIERIEVLKDGASAVYGSDAIAGVVNIITRKNYNGADISWYTGQSSRGDAQINDVALTFGAAGEGGSIIFSAGYYDQQKAMAGDRPFSAEQRYFDATGYNSGTPGQYLAGSSRVPGGRVSLSASNPLDPGNALFQWYQGQFGSSGYLIHDSTVDPTACLAANPGAKTSDCQWRKMKTATMAPSGDLYNFAPSNYLLTPSHRFNLYSSGDRKLGDYARAFFEAMYVNRESKEQLAPEPLIIGPGGVEQNGELVTISADNYYNPFGKEVSLASRRLNEFGNRVHERDIHTFRAVFGVDGTLPDFFGPLKGWSWDASLNYGKTFGTFTLKGNLQNSKIAAALGPSMLVGGVPKCVGTAGDASTVIPGCVPLDLFNGAGSITQDQVDYLTFTGTSKGHNQLTAVQANANGDLFKLFAERPVGLALGYEYRYQSGSFINDPLTAKFDSSNGGSFDTSGSYNVHEGYAELSIPLLSNVPGAYELELDAALRMFRYSNFGSDKTYKLGARWSPFRDLTVRGTYSTAFRAPSISDLYTGQFDNFPNVSDPCAKPANATIEENCGLAAGNGDESTQLRSTNGGNPDLKPETAKIYTLGLVYQPSFLPDLSLTLDYYNIAIEKAIATIGESTILAGCYGGSNPEYCQYVERDPNNKYQITNITNLNANVGKESSAGIDFAARYDLKTANVGRFGFTFDVAWLQKHDQTLADGSVVKGRDTFDLQSSAGQGGTNPTWKANASVNWGLGNFGAGLSTKFLSSFKECGDANGDFSGSGLCYVDDTYQRRVSAYNVYDMFVSYKLTTAAGRTLISAGVNNLFDSAPPKIYNGFASATDQYSYDQLGRYFFLRLNHSI